jgi:serine/threonine protein kinase
MLTREIHHHRRLHHPNVLQLFEVVATENNIWLVSELCAGGELFDYLVEKGRLAETEAKRIFGQICLGVGYIHRQGVVHRDLKLENVLLDEKCNVKIADFGFGREFEQRRLMETFCGTTGYAAPEMLAGKKYTGEGEYGHVSHSQYRRYILTAVPIFDRGRRLVTWCHSLLVADWQSTFRRRRRRYHEA